jgi:hypothetical protein
MGISRYAADSAPAGLRSVALRDAAVATAALIALIWIGSGRLRNFDAALLGYLGPTLAATFGIVYRTSAFWRRPPSAFYGRALLTALHEPRRLRRALEGAGRHLVAQELIARRSRAKWAAHLLLSLGTLSSFAITLPLVFGWLHFEAVDEATYRADFFSIPTVTFAIDGPLGFAAFHALSISAGAVVLGASYFLAARLHRRGEPGAAARFHVAPVLLLLAVALTGLALPASRAMPALYRIAALAHQITVGLLLVGLPFGKLGHLFIRPLQLGVSVVQAGDPPTARCVGCGTAVAPAAQLAAVQRLLAARGLASDGHQDHCPACRRRLLAAAQARLLGADFQPATIGVRPVPLNPAEAA